MNKFIEENVIENNVIEENVIEENVIENNVIENNFIENNVIENNLDFGFIITRHVTSKKTNRYWNRNVKLLRTYYPNKLIVIIDDNSNLNFLLAFHNYKNIITIQSEYIGRGELLPYIYYSKNKWFERAVIIHDGVFFHKRINFEKFSNIPAISLWHFASGNQQCHLENNLRIADCLNYSDIIKSLLHKQCWVGCFGVQCYIKHDFLQFIMNKYNMSELINVVTCREDRCSLERIFAVIFFMELKITKSIFGDMTLKKMWGGNFDSYINNIPSSSVVKVFTGR